MHFTDFGVFDKKVDAVIETAVRKLGYSEAKEFQMKSIEEFVYRKDVFASVLLYRYVLNARERGYVINSHIPLAQLFLHSFPRLFFFNYPCFVFRFAFSSVQSFGINLDAELV